MTRFPSSPYYFCIEYVLVSDLGDISELQLAIVYLNHIFSSGDIYRFKLSFELKSTSDSIVVPLIYVEFCCWECCFKPTINKVLKALSGIDAFSCSDMGSVSDAYLRSNAESFCLRSLTRDSNQMSRFYDKRLGIGYRINTFKILRDVRRVNSSFVLLESSLSESPRRVLIYKDRKKIIKNASSKGRGGIAKEEKPYESKLQMQEFLVLTRNPRPNTLVVTFCTRPINNYFAVTNFCSFINHEYFYLFRKKYSLYFFKAFLDKVSGNIVFILQVDSVNNEGFINEIINDLDLTLCRSSKNFSSMRYVGMEARADTRYEDLVSDFKGTFYPFDKEQQCSFSDIKFSLLGHAIILPYAKGFGADSTITL